jgi:hypothetical protein
MIMNQRIKKLWIKALRSGEYKQGKEALRLLRGRGKPDAFCCLGVLCDLHSKTKNGSKWKGGAYLGDEAELPPPVIEWAGLDNKNPMLGRELSAAEYNDSGKSFNFIANRIEKYL